MGLIIETNPITALFMGIVFGGFFATIYITNGIAEAFEFKAWQQILLQSVLFSIYMSVIGMFLSFTIIEAIFMGAVSGILLSSTALAQYCCDSEEPFEGGLPRSFFGFCREDQPERSILESGAPQAQVITSDQLLRDSLQTARHNDENNLLSHASPAA